MFCVRRTASSTQGVGFVFDDGHERLPVRDLRIAPATGCGSPADFGLPDVPICP